MGCAIGPLYTHYLFRYWVGVFTEMGVLMLAFRDTVTRELWTGDSVHPDEEFICVIYQDKFYWIFNVTTGKPFLPIRFLTKETALLFGRMLHQWYGDYFWIWNNSDWKGVDIPQLVQYTIPNGVELLTILEKSRHKILDNLNEFLPYYQER